MDNVPVTIIVKTPNQQFADQMIHCDIGWTIKRLKNYLSEVYPNKPKSEEQKLIYSGQLLTDAIVLKDILRQYEGQDTHTVHLVFTPKNTYLETVKPKESTQPIAPSTDGLRHRQNATTHSNSPAANSFTLPPQAAAAAAAATTSTPTTTSSPLNYMPQPQFNIPQQQISSLGMHPGIVPSAFLAQQQQIARDQRVPVQIYLAQQIAMQNVMEQVYMQYLNQYMHLARLRGSVIPNATAINTSTSNAEAAAASATNNYFMSQMQSMPYMQNYLQNFQIPNPTPSPTATASPHTLDQQPQPQQPVPDVGAGVAAAAAAVPQADQQIQNNNNGDAAAPAAPRFPNVFQEEVENRDLLDIFYSTIRLMILITLVYFYSSPMRCLIVIGFMVLYYLYHIGFFRNLNGQQEEPNNNNVAAAPDAAVPPVQAPGAAAAAAVAEENVEQPAADNDANNHQENSQQQHSETTEAAPEQNNRMPVIALIRTFILSFFASLIPDTPAL